MTRQQARAIERLNQKIEKARKSGDILSMIKFNTEKREILDKVETEKRVTLKEAMQEYTPEERREATLKIIYAVATADILQNATMDVEETFRRRFGIANVPMMAELREISRRLGKVVKTIDETGLMSFSENYADMVEAIEVKYGATMRNYINNEIAKAIYKK